MNMEIEDIQRTEHHMMVEDSFASGFEIDPKRARFPCCIVWTPLPVISWLIPLIGHIGICREDGVILDFAGPNFVCVDHFAFGAATRYVQIDKDKECFVSSQTLATNNRNDYGHDGHERVTLMAWDDALNKGIQDFQHRSYNMLTCNCHSFVANNLNRLGFRSGGWNVVNLAALIFRKGRWVNRASMIKSLLPFIVVFGLGVIFGGSAFLTYWALFTFVFIGWFLVGTYCFKNLISL